MTLKQYISLVDYQARMALKSDASNYFLGYLWWILEPLLFVAVFYLVFETILNIGRGDFLVFLMCGKLPFMWFSKSITQASNSIVANAGLIGRIDAPKSMYPMAIVQEGLYKQSTVFLLLFIYLWYSGYPPTLHWLWALPVMLVNWVVIVTCAFIGAVLVCFMKDFSMLISLGMIFLMFTSGIFWDVTTLSDPEMVTAIMTFNPVAFLLDAYRAVLMRGEVPDMSHLLGLFCLFLLILAAVVRWMRSFNHLLALKAITA